MADALSMKKNSVNFLRPLYIQLLLKNVYHKRSCHYVFINCGISSRPLHSYISTLVFILTHVRIIGTHKCGNTRREAFNCRLYFWDVLFHCDYAERVVVIFSHQIKYEYCGGNRYALEHISATDQEKSLSSLHIYTCHALFHSFLSDKSK